MMASSIILEYIAPSLGVLVGNYMWLAPYQDIKVALQRGTLNQLNPLPWVFMLGNCIGWVTYGVLQQNVFVFCGNIFGLFLSVWFNLAASKLLYHENAANIGFVPVPIMQGPEEAVTTQERAAAVVGQEEAEAGSIPTTESADTTVATPVMPHLKVPRHDYYALGIVMVWVALLSILGFVTSLTQDQRQFVVGIAANINLLYFYAAPLSTIALVLKTRSTASIHTKTMVVNTTNGCFWAAYGFAVQDYFIYVPNGLGALVGLVQIVLFLVFRSSSSSSSSSSTKESSVSADATTAAECALVPVSMNDDKEVQLDVEAPQSAATLLTTPILEDAIETGEPTVLVLPASGEIKDR